MLIAFEGARYEAPEGTIPGTIDPSRQCRKISRQSPASGWKRRLGCVTGGVVEGLGRSEAASQTALGSRDAVRGPDHGASSNDPSEFWDHLRALLQAQGIDPASAALAESVEQGDDSEFAVVVTREGEVFQFSWAPSAEGVMEWVRTTDSWRDTPYRSGIEDALALLAG